MTDDTLNAFTIAVNGKRVQVTAFPDTPLLWVIRDELGLKGTKYGCGAGLCRACTIHIDGVAAASCQIRMDEVGTSEIITIEGLGPNKVQQAWVDERVPQCGYCQSGQIMTAAALLRGNPHPSDEDISAAMDPNLCRCGTYPRIKKAIKRAAST